MLESPDSSVFALVSSGTYPAKLKLWEAILAGQGFDVAEFTFPEHDYALYCRLAGALRLRVDGCVDWVAVGLGLGLGLID